MGAKTIDSHTSKNLGIENFYSVTENKMTCKYVQAPANSNVNLTTLLQLIGGDKELMKELISILLDTYPVQLADARSAIDARDFKKLHKVSHNLKNSVANFGAEKAYKIACQLEKMGRECHLDKAYETLDELEKEMDRVEDFLTDYKI